MTRLIWKKRTSKKRRDLIIEVMRRSFPDATDDGRGMLCDCEPARTLWVLSLCRDFSRAEYGVDTTVKRCLRWVKSGEPCDHRWCLNHISHPCEGCGRIAGRGDFDPEIGTFSNPENFSI